MHLEGSLEPSLLFELVVKNNITLPADIPEYRTLSALEERYTRFTCLDDFLAFYYIGMSALVDASDFETLAWRYFMKAHEQGVRHAEVFFDAQAHTGRGVALETVVDGFTRARERAQKELGVSSLLIMCFLRHLPAEDAVKTWEAAEPLATGPDRRIDGVGLCSTEKGVDQAAWAAAFRKAGAAGLRLTAHAGEEGPPANLHAAFEHLGVTRIDHGIRAAEDHALLDLLAEKETLLTVCPLSNVRLQCVPSVAHVPLPLFLEKGVRFSINSDDPAYFGGYILENYCAVQDAFGFDTSTWERIVRNGIESSWCDGERKSELLQQLKDVMERHA